MCTALWDGYSRRDQDSNENEVCCFINTGYHGRFLMRIQEGQFRGDRKLSGKENGSGRGRKGVEVWVGRWVTPGSRNKATKRGADP